jgi:hypothetical protein
MTTWTDKIVGARYKTFIVSDHHTRAFKLATKRKINPSSWVYVHSRGLAAPFDEPGIQPARVIVHYMGDASDSVRGRIERFIIEGKVLVEQVEP